LLTLAALLSAAANPLTIDYYDIHGATARELRGDLDRLGPIGETGLRGDGYTHWRIAWKYDLTARGATCSASNIRVTLEVRMILPRWDPPARAASELTATWDEYMAALREHEDGHYRIALHAADEVRAVLGSGRVARDCPLLEKQLNSAANDLLERARQRQAEYDRETDSGRAQGTRIL
jgi:predicted secreted Zn-dependent protease